MKNTWSANDLSDLRKQLDCSLREISQYIGFASHKSWLNRENGKIDISEAFCIGLCNKLNLKYFPSYHDFTSQNKRQLKRQKEVMYLKRLVKPYIEKGMGMSFAARENNLEPVKLKGKLRGANIKYPDKDVLRDNYCQYYFNMSFFEFIEESITLQRSNNYIARLLKIEVSGLYKLTKRLGINIKSRTYKLDEESKRNIVKAMKARIRTRNKACLISHRGRVKTLSEWSALTGISSATLRRRIFELKWPVYKALKTDPADYEPFFTSKAREERKSIVNKGSSKPSIKSEEKCKQIIETFNNCSSGEVGKYYMVKLLYTDRLYHEGQDEEMEMGRLYIDENGLACSLDRAAILSDYKVLQAYIEFLSVTKNSDHIYGIESFKTTNDLSNVDISFFWRSKINTFLNKHQFNL